MSIDGIEERERQLKVLLKELGNEISLQLPSNYGGQFTTLRKVHHHALSHCHMSSTFIEDRRRRVQKSRQKLDQAESLVSRISIYLSHLSQPFWVVYFRL